MNFQLPSIINFLVYLGISVPLIGIGIYAFIRTTPYDDFAILRAGSEEALEHRNAAVATACDLGGKILGLAFVLTSAITHSVNWLDFIIWGVLGIIFEISVFCLFRRILPLEVTKEIPRGNISVGVISATLSIASGLLMAALLTY